MLPEAVMFSYCVMRISYVAEEILSSGCAVAAAESILVYAYILMRCFKNQGFWFGRCRCRRSPQ